MGGTLTGRFRGNPQSCSKSEPGRRGEERDGGYGWRGGESIAVVEGAMTVFTFRYGLLYIWDRWRLRVCGR
jgi:hypothetical protein